MSDIVREARRQIVGAEPYTARILSDLCVEVERLRAGYRYPHMCQDDHPRIGHWDSESEMCPVCELRAEVERLRQERDAHAPLVQFVRTLMREWQDGDRGDIDGGQIQELAVEAGVIVPEQRMTPCSPEGCDCQEFAEPGEPFTCYRIIDAAFVLLEEGK